MIEPTIPKVGDTITLGRKMSTARGVIKRIDISAKKGIGFHIDGYPGPLWVGPQAFSWSITDRQAGISDQ